MIVIAACLFTFVVMVATKSYNIPVFQQFGFQRRRRSFLLWLGMVAGFLGIALFIYDLGLALGLVGFLAAAFVSVTVISRADKSSTDWHIPVAFIAATIAGVMIAIAFIL
jgi:hypothetical protein